MAVLREELTGDMAIGLVLLAASFAVLIAGARGTREEAKQGTSMLARFGSFYGVVSALGYSPG